MTALRPTVAAARQVGRRDVEHELDLEVTAPGHSGYTVTLTDRVPHDKTPVVGQALPVTVSAADPQRVEVDWDRAPSLTERALAAGEAATAGDPDAAARALGFEPQDPQP